MFVIVSLSSHSHGMIFTAILTPVSFADFSSFLCIHALGLRLLASSLHSLPWWSHQVLQLSVSPIYWLLTNCPSHISPLNMILVFLCSPGCLTNIFKYKVSKTELLFFSPNPVPPSFPSQFMANLSSHSISNPVDTLLLSSTHIYYPATTYCHHPSPNHQHVSLELLQRLLIGVPAFSFGHFSSDLSSTPWENSLKFLCWNFFNGFLSQEQNIHSYYEVLSKCSPSFLLSPSLCSNFPPAYHACSLPQDIYSCHSFCLESSPQPTSAHWPPSLLCICLLLLPSKTQPSHSPRSTVLIPCPCFLFPTAHITFYYTT